MATYLAKRLLVMIPTFFAISLVVFVIINLAPGTPGAQRTLQGTERASGSKREAWRIFKAQFNLDKPILVNTRFTISREDVLQALRKARNKDQRFEASEQMEAMEWLEDCARFTVPHLIDLIEETGDPGLRHFELVILSENAKRKVKYEYGGTLPEETKELNKAIRKENRTIGKWVCSANASKEEWNRVTSKWQKWFERVKEERYNYGFLEKAGVLFLETRFALYWWNLIHLDFGVSHVDKKPVLSKVLHRLKYSLTITVPSVILAYLISIPLGIFSAIRRNTMEDRALSVILFMLYSLPSFFVGTMLLLFFSQGSDWWHWFPTGGWQSQDIENLTLLGQIKDVLWHLVLPLSCMTYGSLAVLSRYARTGLLEVINADYIKTARAKGLPESTVILKHTVRNGMIPVITLLGTVLPILIGGSVIIEYIFSIPGMGLLTYNAILTRDYNTIMAVQLISAVLVMLGILLSDILYAIVDPRITYK